MKNKQILKRLFEKTEAVCVYLEVITLKKS